MNSSSLAARSASRRRGEAFVIDPKSWRVAYHGPIDASFGDKRRNASARGRARCGDGRQGACRSPKLTVKGTKIDFPDRAKAASFTKISYAKDVAPILADKCLACHTEGGMGPFAMNSYDVVKAMSPMIREALRTGRMPPTTPTPTARHWVDDMRLSHAQLKTVVNWVEAGAPRGTGEDPLPTAAKPAPKWPLGEPDLRRAGAGLRRARQRHHRLPGPFEATALHRRQVAEGGRLGQRHPGRAPRPGRLDPERRSRMAAASPGTWPSAATAPAAPRT